MSPCHICVLIRHLVSSPLRNLLVADMCSVITSGISDVLTSPLFSEISTISRYYPQPYGLPLVLLIIHLSRVLVGNRPSQDFLCTIYHIIFHPAFPHCANLRRIIVGSCSLFTCGMLYLTRRRPRQCNSNFVESVSEYAPCSRYLLSCITLHQPGHPICRILP